jgi:beta-D-galactosyl-(1->4)-L-rhamnose phosphorylase
VTDPETRVLNARGDTPVLTLHSFGKGKAVYMGDFFYTPVGARMLLEMLLALTGKDGSDAGLTDQYMAECAWYPESGTLVVMNNSDEPMDVNVSLPFGRVQVHAGAEEIRFVEVNQNR